MSPTHCRRISLPSASVSDVVDDVSDGDNMEMSDVPPHSFVCGHKHDGLEWREGSGCE